MQARSFAALSLRKAPPPKMLTTVDEFSAKHDVDLPKTQNHGTGLPCFLLRFRVNLLPEQSEEEIVEGSWLSLQL